MPTIQYTLRSIPPELDRAIRKKARLSGKSINRVVLDDVISANGLDKTSGEGALSGLQWFIGLGADNETMRILEEDDKLQKRLAAKENNKINKLGI